jgi:hypothetical protein
MNKLARLAASLQRAATTSGVAAQPQVRCGPITPAGRLGAWVVTAQPAPISKRGGCVASAGRRPCWPSPLPGVLGSQLACPILPGVGQPGARWAG